MRTPGTAKGHDHGKALPGRPTRPGRRLSYYLRCRPGVACCGTCYWGYRNRIDENPDYHGCPKHRCSNKSDSQPH